MVTRRRILKSAAIASTAALTLPAIGRTRLPESSRFGAVWVDRRFRMSGRFAAAARAFGDAVLEFSGGIADIWYQNLYTPAKAGRPVPTVAGLTTDSDWLFLSQVALGIGYRSVQLTVHESEHEDGAAAAIRLATCRASHPVSPAQVSPALFHDAAMQSQQIFSWVLSPESRR